MYPAPGAVLSVFYWPPHSGHNPGAAAITLFPAEGPSTDISDSRRISPPGEQGLTWGLPGGRAAGPHHSRGRGGLGGSAAKLLGMWSLTEHRETLKHSFSTTGRREGFPASPPESKAGSWAGTNLWCWHFMGWAIRNQCLKRFLGSWGRGLVIMKKKITF